LAAQPTSFVLPYTPSYLNVSDKVSGESSGRSSGGHVGHISGLLGPLSILKRNLEFEKEHADGRMMPNIYIRKPSLLL
jgi:hypothetical protein